MGGDWSPEACAEKGCRVEGYYNIDHVCWEIGHWHPAETTIAGVRLEVVDRVDPAIRDELARVAHLPRKPRRKPAYGVRWYRQKTLAEVMDGA